MVPRFVCEIDLLFVCLSLESALYLLSFKGELNSFISSAHCFQESRDFAIATDLKAFLPSVQSIVG